MSFKKAASVFIFLLLNIIGVHAQKTNDYNSDWKKVAEFEKKGLTKSALELVITIFNNALAAGNEPQQIKSAMYQMKYRNMVEEDNSEKNIFYLDTLIAKTKAPAKNILQSMQAQLFWSYKQNNRYKFYNRTDINESASEKETATDIATWSLKKLNETITARYKSSLQNEQILKQQNVSAFDNILQKGINTRQLRPTLYDLLANRALDYFMNTENDVTNPSYKFILDDERLFSPAKTFTQINFTTKDSASLYFNAVKLLQDLLRFHASDNNPDALLDADLKRLWFVYNFAVAPSKNKLYENALLEIEKSYPANPAAAQAMYLRAEMYRSTGLTYNSFIKKDVQFDIKKAVTLSEEIIKRFPGSTGAINAQNLLQQIRQPSLDLATEKVNVVNEPFRTLVTYKNAKKIYLRVIKTNRDELKKIENSDYEKIWTHVVKLSPVKSWSVELPDQQDFQVHSTEIKIDELPTGTYIILASIDPGFSIANNFLAKQVTYVSNISTVQNNDQGLYVLDRNTGEPLAAAEVQVWKRTYNYSSRNNEDVKMGKYVSDKTGFVKLPKTTANDNYNYYLQVKYKNDELFGDESYYAYNYNGYKPKETKQVFLFTDRSIYRPGQTVFFKGIVINTSADGRKSNIVPGYSSNVILYDVNRQKVATLKLTANDFGSYNGSFKLPEGILNGQFQLTDSASQSMKYFNVEEYKRPTFSTEIKNPEGTYKLNDSISVVGNAKAYAGSNVDGAKVKYRVVRRIQYPVWFGWGRYIPMGSREQMEIANGETTTDATGKFTVTFKAIPDETADKKNQPVFYYDVSADVTDINGETRSGNTSVAVSYQALQLNIGGPEKMPADSLKKVTISSTNLSGAFEKATVLVSIQKLQSPGRIFRSRYWNQPDQFVMSKESYRKDFPFDIYSDEDDMSKWPVTETVINVTDTTTATGAFNLRNNGLAEGWYKVTAVSKDKYGEEVKSEKFIQVLNSKKLVTDEPVFVNIKTNEAQPGQKISYGIATGFDKIWLLQYLFKANKDTIKSFASITVNNAYENEINITEQDLGGIGMSYLFVRHNRVYQGSSNFSIPWKEKELQIGYETFRDKILPGSEEKWSIKISGSRSEKVAAEALISMYDASLDQFRPHSWSSLLSIWPGNAASIHWTAYSFDMVNSIERNNMPGKYIPVPEKSYDELIDNGWNSSDYGRVYSNFGIRRNAAPSAAAPMVTQDAMLSEVVTVGYGASKKAVPGSKLAGGTFRESDELKVADSTTVLKGQQENSNNNNNTNNLQIRKNFNETAFFFPDLKTDANGNISFSFTIPDALTTWKMMSLAHTKELASAYSERTVITQKPLMIQANAPRFLREGDEIEFSAKVTNLSEKEITGTAQLELFDAATNKPVDGWFKNVFPNQYFTVAAGQTVAVKFPAGIPVSFNSALLYRIKAVAKDGSFSDGEEAALPVLTNRMLVTETLPLNMRNTNSRNFKFEKLLNSASSGSLTNHALTVEYTSNPAWYAVQALPYLMEYPYECAEQTFNRYYANVLAGFVANSTPKIRAIFDQWKISDTAALMSNLQKNEALKSALLEETPWVLQAKSETEQKKNIAVLFDMIRLSREKMTSLNKLKQMQSSNGGFTWFKGGPDDRYMTQYIITGIGHLRKLNALSSDDYSSLKPMLDKAVLYLDARLADEYNNLVKYKTDLKKNNLSYAAIQYLYMRSFFPETKIPSLVQKAYSYYRTQSQQYWLSNNKYMQAMIALALHRTDDKKTPIAIIASLKQNAIYKEEMGMYFKEFTTGGYYWYQAPIESQALIIEAFSDIDKNATTVDDLKMWLLKQKQTQNWRTTKATAEACYALLLNGTNWLAEEKEVTINLGNTVVKSTDTKAEAGTGYFTKKIEGSKVQQGMGNITVSVRSVDGKPATTSGSWGAVYWQYFENLDKITSAETPLKLVKQLYVEKNSDKGPVLTLVKDGQELKIGDKIKVRIELRVDRDMEYVHMKDMRAACMEPVNVISSYKYQGGLGYYESTKDASTNFFFSWLNRGTYVFEYPLFVTHSGNYSNGITTIQCMYAPEFSSHSEGIRVNVE